MAVIVFDLNELRRRVGESHHRAKLTNAEVEVIRDLHAEKAMGYRKLAQKFEISSGHVRRIIKLRVRAQVPTDWKLIRTGD
jgi:hypothetical protein